MQLIKIISAVAFGHKRNIAVIGMVIVYCLNRFFGVSASETDIEQLILTILGAVGVVHGAWKSETVRNIVAGIKAKSKELEKKPS